MQNRILFLLMVLFITGSLCAQQQTLWLLNGKKKTITNYKLSTNGVDSVLTYTSENGKEKQVRYDEVFSVVKADGSEDVIYNPAIFSAINFIPDAEALNANQMRSYLHGMNDAKEVKLSPATLFITFGLGLGGGLIPPVVFSNQSDQAIGIPVGILVPATTIVVAGSMGTSDEKMKQYFPDKMNDESYLIGAEETIRKKRLRQSIIGSCVGFVAGFLIIQSL